MLDLTKNVKKTLNASVANMTLMKITFCVPIVSLKFVITTILM